MYHENKITYNTILTAIESMDYLAKNNPVAWTKSRSKNYIKMLILYKLLRDGKIKIEI